MRASLLAMRWPSLADVTRRHGRRTSDIASAFVKLTAVSPALRLICALIALSSCSSPADVTSTDIAASKRDPFIAFAGDFDGFHDWERLFIPAAELDDPIHGGNRSIYINRRPPKGSAQYPVGTIIVKQMESPTGHTFAMVKRGGGFNPEGATGWEWFRIVDTNGVVSIAWRGMGPPDGETYGGDAGGVCNGCHFAGKANDWVQYSGLKL